MLPSLIVVGIAPLTRCNTSVRESCFTTGSSRKFCFARGFPANVAHLVEFRVFCIASSSCFRYRHWFDYDYWQATREREREREGGREISALGPSLFFSGVFCPCCCLCLRVLHSIYYVFASNIRGVAVVCNTLGQV